MEVGLKGDCLTACFVMKNGYSNGMMDKEKECLEFKIAFKGKKVGGRQTMGLVPNGNHHGFPICCASFNLVCPD